MPAIRLDRNLHRDVRRLLRAAGHNCVQSISPSIGRLPDFELLFTTTREGRLFVTHNVDDFVFLHRAWVFWTAQWGIDEPHCPLLLMTQAGITPLELADAIIALLATSVPAGNTAHRWRPDIGWSPIE
ncbi:MAG: DUF5615 family PIN-like protein [Gemmatimonadaceae bacterium]